MPGYTNPLSVQPFYATHLSPILSMFYFVDFPRNQWITGAPVHRGIPLQTNRLAASAWPHRGMECKASTSEGQTLRGPFRSHGGGTFTVAIPAARAAWMPMSVSSKTRHTSGATPRFVAAIRNASGSGLLF